MAIKNRVRKGKVAIVQYGLPNAAIYRREDVTGVKLPENILDLLDLGNQPGQKAEYNTYS